MMIVIAIVVILVIFVSTYATPPRPIYTMLFSSASNLSHSGKFSLSRPDMATYGNNVYVVWASNNTGSSDVYFKSIRVGGGTSFGNTINLSHDVGFSGSPQVAANGNNVYVVWASNNTGSSDVYFKASKNSGASFASQENLSSNNTGSSQFPQIAVSRDNVYVVWEYNSDGHHNILFNKSTNSGASFASQENLSSNNTGSSFSPLVTATGNDVYVIWQDVAVGNSDIYFKASKNSGASFGNTINLSHDVGFSGSPQISTSGNDAHVVWQGITAINSDIYFKSIRGGNILANTITLSHDAGFSGSPQILISVHNIYLVWTENISGQSDVYFKRARWSMVF
jgi:glutaredoxin